MAYFSWQCLAMFCTTVQRPYTGTITHIVNEIYIEIKKISFAKKNQIFRSTGES